MTGICVVGGGAAGMIAAAAARMENPGVSICIIEKKHAPGRKLLATGNGRCNLTNSFCENSTEILDFFNLLGIKFRVEEQGRVYPYSGQAKDVLKAFLLYFNARNVEIITDFAVKKLEFTEAGIRVFGGDREVAAKRVLLATGGKAAPQFGCDGDGCRIARASGHTVTTMVPALSPVECFGDFKELAGIRVKAAVSLIRRRDVLRTEDGEVQFTDYGISGICVFNLSRWIRLSDCEFKDYELVIDLFPGVSAEDVAAELKSRSDMGIPDDNLLLSIVPDRLAAYIIEKAKTYGYDGNKRVRVEEIAGILKKLSFTVSNVKGWRFAQCTSGGVPFAEINADTMESKLQKGLYFAGELLDYDGPCGGYNLNNAWTTGIKAGKAMAVNV